MDKPASPKEFSNLLDRLISRRHLLELGGTMISWSALAVPLAGCNGGGSGSDDASTPSSEIPQPSKEYTTLKRTSFGVTQNAMNDIQLMGISDYLAQQLDYETIDDGDLEATIAGLFPLSRQSAAQLITGFPDNIAAIAIDMASATQYRQFYSQRQLFEIMVEFWSDHFNIHLVNGLGPTLKPDDDRDVIRRHALGNFGDLLHASALSPAMLFYLDNYNNFASAPNENYARELLELHTLGVDGGYTEQDIKDVARCFTGWSLTFPGSGTYGTFVFQTSWHDDGEKVVLGQTIPAGGGQSDGQQVLDSLINHPATAQFIATKLCRRFIEDEPDEVTVNQVAAAFSTSSGDIKETLKALFESAAFLTHSDQKFTRPSEYLAQIVRALGPDNYPSDNGQLFYFAQLILGQLPFFWPTPDGYPDEQSYWAGTGGLLNRWRLSFLSLAPVLPEIDVFDIDYVSLLEGARSLNEIVRALEKNMLMRTLADIDRESIVNGLVSSYGQSADFRLSEQDASGVAALVAATLISSVYFHLR